VFSLLSLILGPVLSFFDKIFGYVASTETAKITTEAQVEETSIQTMGAVEQKWSFVAWMIPLFALPYAIWTIKAVGWDKVIGPVFGYNSTTDALNGDLSKAYWIIISGIFLHAISRG
jgi:hypothetical protein